MVRNSIKTLGHRVKLLTSFRRLLQLAESKGAIIITPDYRLVPEARGVDILEDVKDFWTWVHNSFPSKVSSALPKDASVDVNKIAACGESAGGYLALQSGFLFPEARIKLIMAQYGTLDIDHPDYNRGPHTVPASGSAVDKYISNLKPGAIRINSPNPDRWDFCMEVLQEGRHHDLIGNEPDLHLMDTMKRAKNIPPIWFAQGTTDEIVSNFCRFGVIGNEHETDQNRCLKAWLTIFTRLSRSNTRLLLSI